MGIIEFKSYKMNKAISIVLFFGISCSCFSQIDKETQLILNETKSEIYRCLDSSNYYFDLVISEHNKGVDNETLIRKYSSSIDFWERRINDVLDNVNRLGLNGYLTQEQADDWLKDIYIKPAKQKAKLEKIKRFGIDFSEVPFTHYYSLNGLYSDSLNRFSIQFPEDWITMPNYNPYTLMAKGPVLIDTITGLSVDAVFIVNVNEKASDFTTEQYYLGNLKSMKKSSYSFKILTEKDINIDGIPAKYVACEISNKGITMASIQIYFTTNTKTYILSGSGPVYYWDTLKYLFAEISRTFKIQ